MEKIPGWLKYWTSALHIFQGVHLGRPTNHPSHLYAPWQMHQQRKEPCQHQKTARGCPTAPKGQSWTVVLCTLKNGKCLPICACNQRKRSRSHCFLFWGKPGAQPPDGPPGNCQLNAAATRAANHTLPNCFEAKALCWVSFSSKQTAHKTVCGRHSEVWTGDDKRVVAEV